MGKLGLPSTTGRRLVFLLVLLCGCTTPVGNPLDSLTPRSQLSKSAKALRLAAPEPLPLPRELDKRILPPYTVEPGDVLLIQPADLDSPVRLPGDQPVFPDGMIHLGRYGQLMVAGKTVEEIEALVRAAVQTQTKEAGFIMVRVVTRASKVYYVLGEVNAPGAFPLAGRETVLDGLLVAGGATDRASLKNILLIRPTPTGSCRVVLPVCYREIVQVGDTSTNYQLAPGDRIFVPGRGLWEQLHDALQLSKDCPPCGAPQTPCFTSSGAPATP